MTVVNHIVLCTTYVRTLNYMQHLQRYLTIICTDSLFVCKSSPLLETHRNDPHPLMRPWDVFLRGATTCPWEKIVKQFLRIGVEGVVQPQHLGTHQVVTAYLV